MYANSISTHGMNGAHGPRLGCLSGIIIKKEKGKMN